ncbi:MAG: hypothetical protein ABGW90_15340 [Martelella sp.]
MTTFASPALTADEWVPLVDGATYENVLLQLRGVAPAHIYVGAGTPGAGETEYLTISQAVFPGVALTLGADESVFARAATSIGVGLEGARTAR